MPENFTTIHKHSAVRVYFRLQKDILNNDLDRADASEFVDGRIIRDRNGVPVFDLLVKLLRVMEADPVYGGVPPVRKAT